jgi:hypothetical protein
MNSNIHKLFGQKTNYYYQIKALDFVSCSYFDNNWFSDLIYGCFSFISKKILHLGYNM